MSSLVTTLTETAGGFEVRCDGRLVWEGTDYLAAYLVAKSLRYVVPSTPEQSRAYWKGVSGA